MAEFEPFNLGHVLQTAEAIKGMRRQGDMDRLQQQYMGQRMTQDAAAESRAATTFSQEQQVTNTKLLNAAAAEVAQNPQAAARWLPQLQQAGIIDPSLNWQQIPPEQLQQAATGLYQSTSAALAALNGGTTADYTNPEAGMQNGQEVVYQVNKTTGQPRIVPGVTPRPQKPLVQLDTSQRFETAAEKAFGEKEGKDFSDQLARGQDAQERRQRYQALLDNPATTGPTQDFRASANSFFADLGVPLSQDKIQQITNLAQYKSVSGELIAEELRQNTGVQTEGDAQRVREYNANANSIGESNRAVLRYQMAIAQRQEMLAQMAEAYREENGKIDGWRKSQREFIRSTPLSGFNPESKRLVFFNEFQDAMQHHNPGMSQDNILTAWRTKYGGK